MDDIERPRTGRTKRRCRRALEEARDTLELVTVGAADGITIQDARGALVYANLAAARLSGYGSVDEFMAADPRERLAHWEMLKEDGEPFPIDELPGRRVLGGVPEAEAVLRVRDRRDGREFWSLVKATATFDAQGNVRYAINLFRDITGQKEAERSANRKATQMSHLYAITAALSETTDVAAIAEALAEQTLTAFEASRGAVVLRSQDGEALETVAWRGHEAGVIERWRSFPLDATTPIGDAVLRNVPVVMGSREEWLARYPGLEREQIPGGGGFDPVGHRGPGDRRPHAQFRRASRVQRGRHRIHARRRATGGAGVGAWSLGGDPAPRRGAALAPRSGGRPPRRVARLPEDPRRGGRPGRASARRLGIRGDPGIGRLDPSPSPSRTWIPRRWRSPRSSGASGLRTSRPRPGSGTSSRPAEPRSSPRSRRR